MFDIKTRPKFKHANSKTGAGMTNAFTASGLFATLFSDPEIAAEFHAASFTQRMLDFEAAWSRALGASGAVSEQNASAAVTAIKNARVKDLGTGSDKDGLPVPALVDGLRHDQPEDVAFAIHTGATSQDVIDTAMVLTCLSVLSTLTGRIETLSNDLAQLTEQFGDAPILTRTRMQAALPATANLRIQAWARPLADHLERAKALTFEIKTLQIGGPIGTRSTPYAHVTECAPLVADELNLRLVPVWHTDRSRIIAFGHWLTLVAGTLGKIGQDVALMAQQGIDEITLKGGGGSSAMAHKQNPVKAEAMITLARYVAGQQGILAQAMVHEQERSGAAWALEWLTLPAMAEAVGASLNHAATLMSSIEKIGSSNTGD